MGRSPGRAVRIRDRTRGEPLAERALVADSFLGRFRGLMLTRELSPGTGLVLDPCNSVHTFFMRYPIDVLFTGSDGEVMAVVSEMRPWRITRIHRGARYAVELPAGTARRAGVEPGDALDLQPVGNATGAHSEE